MRDMWSMPRTRLLEAPLTLQAVKLAEEVGEVMEAVLILKTSLNDHKRQQGADYEAALASELFDVIQVASSMLAGLEVKYGTDIATGHHRHIEKMRKREQDYNL